MAKLEVRCKDNVDGGYAWVILSAVSLCTFLDLGNFKTFGIYFVTFLEEFRASAAVTSLFSATYSIAYSFFALLVEAVLLERFSCRQIIIFGGFFTTIAIILSSFAERIEVLIFTHGILIALGSVCLHGPSLIILGKYFDKRRGMSNSVALAFGSIGGLIHPIMFTTFVNTFGLRGALLMQAGVMFHSVLGGALSRPITLSEKIQRPEFKDKQSIDNEENNLESLLSEDERKNVQVANGQNETTIITDYGDQEYQVHKIRTSLDMLESTSCTSHNEASIVYTRKVFETKCCGYDIKNVLRKFDFKMLKNKLVFLFSLVFGFATVSSVLGQMYIPPLARDRGVSEDLIGYLAAGVGASELMGRIILAFIADTRHIHKYQILMIALFFNGLVQQFSRLTRTFERLMIFSVSYGLFCGAMHSLYTPICIDFVGLEDFHKALGILHMIQGLITGIMGYTIGLLRDVTGGYDVGFNVMGGAGLLSSLLLFFVPCIQQKETSFQV